MLGGDPADSQPSDSLAISGLSWPGI
jgi:hypothetical protein